MITSGIKSCWDNKTLASLTLLVYFVEEKSLGALFYVENHAPHSEWLAVQRISDTSLSCDWPGQVDISPDRLNFKQTLQLFGDNNSLSRVGGRKIKQSLRWAKVPGLDRAEKSQMSLAINFFTESLIFADFFTWIWWGEGYPTSGQSYSEQTDSC